MLKTVAITNPLNGQTMLSLSLIDRHPSTPYIVKSITGLTAVNLELFLGEQGYGSSNYRGRHNSKRNIVINMKLQPDWTQGRDLQKIRDELYQVFLPARPESDNPNSANYGSYFGMLVFDTDPHVPIKQIPRCYIEKIEVDIFSKEPTAMISIISPDPMLYSASPIWYQNPQGVSGYDFTVGGHVPDGVRMTLLVPTPGDYLSIHAYDLSGAHSMMYLQEANRPLSDPLFDHGDLVDIDTRPGHRKIIIRRPGETRDVTHLLMPNSKWIMTRLGPNGLGIWGSWLGTPNGATLVRFEYYNAWWSA